MTLPSGSDVQNPNPNPNPNPNLTSGSDVQKFNDQSFKRAKNLNEWVVVLFTAPWSSEAHYASQVNQS